MWLEDSLMQHIVVHLIETVTRIAIASCFQKLRLTPKEELSSSLGSILQPPVMLRRGWQEIRQKCAFNKIKRILSP